MTRKRFLVGVCILALWELVQVAGKEWVPILKVLNVKWYIGNRYVVLWWVVRGLCLLGLLFILKEEHKLFLFFKQIVGAILNMDYFNIYANDQRYK